MVKDKARKGYMIFFIVHIFLPSSKGSRPYNHPLEITSHPRLKIALPQWEKGPPRPHRVQQPCLWKYVPGILLVILEVIISSSKIPLLMSHGCVLHLFVSWVLDKAQGTGEGKGRALKVYNGEKRETCQQISVTFMIGIYKDYLLSCTATPTIPSYWDFQKKVDVDKS